MADHIAGGGEIVGAGLVPMGQWGGGPTIYVSADFIAQTGMAEARRAVRHLLSVPRPRNRPTTTAGPADAGQQRKEKS